MSVPILIVLSGPSFSFLLYENSKSLFRQEGFLLGEIIHKEVKTITDNDQQQINTSKTVKISSIMPCPQPHFFYSKSGKVDKNKVKEFLGDEFDNVVAWYKFQKISSFKFLLRDKIVHKQLIELFGISPELFTCCFLISEVSDNGSTHLFSQSFMRYSNNKYDQLPIHIPNLSEPNNTYKMPEPASFTFNKLLCELRVDKLTTQGLVVINKINGALQKHINNVIIDLSTSEQIMHALEEEIKVLKLKKIKKKNEEDNNKYKMQNNPQDNHLASLNSKSSGINNVSPEILPDQNLTKTLNPKVKGRSRSAKDVRDRKLRSNYKSIDDMK